MRRCFRGIPAGWSRSRNGTVPEHTIRQAEHTACRKPVLYESPGNESCLSGLRVLFFRIGIRGFFGNPRLLKACVAEQRGKPGNLL